MNDINTQAQFNYTTAPVTQNKEQTILIEKEKRVVPIIFIPGVMGSNLRVKPSDSNDKNTDKVWRLDNKATAIGWSMPHYGTAKARKLELDPNITVVDDRGTVVDAASKEMAQIDKEYTNKLNALYDDQVQKMMDMIDARSEEIEIAIQSNPENKRFGTRKARGWGSVAYMSYGPFLETLQESLFNPGGDIYSVLANLTQPLSFSLDKESKERLTLDKEQLDYCNIFDLPVYALGYNWLESNEDSANTLKELVEVTLPKYYKKRGRTCDKVILVTHSMGGLVARYYTEALGGAGNVYGVIHGVQPATGAAAAYTRMKRGTEVNTTFLNKPKDGIMENVLGKDAAEMTAVCAQSPGPLQLLPTPEYGMGWLTIKAPDSDPKSYPTSDPYTEIYLDKDKWWCVCEPHLINPLNEYHNQPQMQEDWDKYESIIRDKVKKFNGAIANKYHPNTYAFFGIQNNDKNIPAEFLTYQTAYWQGHFGQGYQTSMRNPATDHMGAKNRLDLAELKGLRTITASRHDWVGKGVASRYGYHTVKKGNINETYTLLPADGNGDGTVPKRSGEIPMTYLKARTHLPIGHEPAYQSPISQEFTLRSIVNILQQVTFNETTS